MRASQQCRTRFQLRHTGQTGRRLRRQHALAVKATEHAAKASRQTLPKYWVRVGRTLSRTKKTIGHGGWLAWLKSNTTLKFA